MIHMLVSKMNIPSSERVSVIIPVYNTAPYLNRCVESVLRQSYTALEVLLIDDGSTDTSGLICDQWAEIDSRIKVVHKENGGLSDARNNGLAIATGEYIAFINSDDYINTDMIIKLYNAITMHHADISICNFHYVDESGTPILEWNQYLPIKDEVISGNEAITKMLTIKKCWCYDLAWNKLYRKELFSDIEFPIGKICEDGFISHMLFGKCEAVACISDVCYYYTQRAGSIMHSDIPYVFLHQAEARLHRMLYCYARGLNRCAGLSYWRAALFLSDTYQMGYKSPKLQAEKNDVLHILRENKRFRKYCTLKEKIQISLTCFSPELYCLLFRNTIWQRIKPFLNFH